MPHLVVGVDVGGTKVRAACATPHGDLLDETEVPTPPAGGRAVVDAVVACSRRVSGDAWPRVAAVAVGTPGSVHPVTGLTDLAQNVAGLEQLDLGNRLQDALDRPVAVENDANLAALGELRHGHGTGVADAVVVSIGTGVGAGVVMGGRLRRGASGAAGEVAFLPLAGDPWDRRAQAAGVFEQAVATPGFVRRYRAAGGRADGAREVFAAAEAGDGAARSVVAAVAEDLALGLAALVAILDPGLIVLGGGIGARAAFVEQTAAALRRLTPRPPRLAVSALGDRAALHGALALARDLAADGPVTALWRADPAARTGPDRRS